MFTITRTCLNGSILTFIALVFISCSEDPIEPVNGVDGVNGFNALVDIQAESEGDNCSAGGVRIAVGQDSNSNGILDEAEIQSVTFVCNGASGNDGNNGIGLVARTSPENPGANCEFGGTLVEIGIDSNSNNSLDDDEVQSSFYVCNGQNGSDGSAGSDGLTSLMRVTSSTDCANGGITVELGLDDDMDGSLGSDEVDATYDICNGANGIDGFTTLSNVTTEAPGGNCSNGGLKVELGVDTNRNGVLDTDEVISENYVCNGTDGSNGFSSITRVTSENPGTNCENGGLMLEMGLDDVSIDGVLQDDEVDYTYFVCNGANGSNGLNSLIKTTTEDPGSNCSEGGIQIEIGLDNNSNGILDVDEVIGSAVYVCNGLNGTNGADGSDGKSVFVTSENDRSCANGGVALTFGYDNNNDGDLSDPEDQILVSHTVCNGIDGNNGNDGKNSIIRTTNEDPGINCANGGTLVEVGIDDNGNNNLDDDPNEVDASFYVCNGSDGESISMTSIYNAGLCSGNGGRTLTFGYDFDSNGTIDQVLQTFVVCDGADGSNGSDGNTDGVYEFYFYNGVSIYNGISVYSSASDSYIDEEQSTTNFDKSGLVVGSGDRNVKFSLLKFDGLDEISNTTDNFEVLEAGLYLHSSGSTGTGENYLGVKSMAITGSLFDQANATFSTPDGSGSWSGEFFDISQDATGSFMDMFRIPNSISFEGVVPLQLNRTLIENWILNPETTNYGMVLQFASNGNTKSISMSDSEDEDKYLRPVLYVKILDNNSRARSSVMNEHDYKNWWKSLSYEEKIAPLVNRK